MKILNHDVTPKLRLVLVAAVVCCIWTSFGASSVSKPNVLFVISDQWRACAFGYAGDPNVKTPHFDKLAAESVNFVNAIAGMPVCCPSRASIMTGERPLTTGVFLNDAPLSTNAVSLAEALRAAGYDTGYIGKWHLNGGIRTRYVLPERRQGFEYWKGSECTHDYNHSLYHADDSPTPRYWRGYDAIAQTRDAEGYLWAHAKSAKPFLLFLSWGPPHNPYQTAPAYYRKMYDPATLKLRPNVPRSHEARARRDLAGYYAHCTALDDCMGSLLQTLKETGLEKNTLLIFTSDHGAMLQSHGGYDKQQPYDEANHTPLLMYWPDGLGTQGHTLDALINRQDLMPTILGLCGAAIPKTVQGLDYSCCIRGGPNPSDGTTLLSCVNPFGTWSRRVGGREYRGIRTLRYTYVRDLKGPWLLFDNQADPYQMTNLVGNAECTQLQARLDELLKRKLAETRDKFLPGEYYLRKWGYQVNAIGDLPH